MTTKELLEKVKVGEGMSATDMAYTFGVSRMQMHNYLKGNSEIKITTLFTGLQKLGYDIKILKDGLDKN
jgi:predicted transcriptional regulator